MNFMAHIREILAALPPRWDQIKDGDFVVSRQPISIAVKVADEFTAETRILQVGETIPKDQFRPYQIKALWKLGKVDPCSSQKPRPMPEPPIPSDPLPNPYPDVQQKGKFSIAKAGKRAV